MTKTNPTLDEFDLTAFEELAQAVTSGGIRWDRLEADPKKYVANYRRICPKKADAQWPFQVVFVHYAGPSNRLMLCPRGVRLGECPLCIQGFALIKQGAKDEGKEMLSNMRVFLNVVRLTEEGKLKDEEVYLLSLSQTSFYGSPTGESEEDEILANLFREYGDISHIETGRNLAIRARTVKRGRFEFNKLKFEVSDPCPFPGSDDLLNTSNDLSAVAPLLDPKEMVDTAEGRSFGFALVGPATPLAALPGRDSTTAPAEEIPAPTVTKPGAFARRDEEEEPEEEEAATEEPEEVEAPATRRATARATSVPVPKTNPATAAARLQQRINRGK